MTEENEGTASVPTVAVLTPYEEEFLEALDTEKASSTNRIATSFEAHPREQHPYSLGQSNRKTVRGSDDF